MRKHGYADPSNQHPIYRAWIELRRRCTKRDRHEFKYYGARGITFDSRWDSFENFLADMGPTWKRGLSLGRRDNGGNYCAKNCEWQNRKAQMRNTRQNRIIELNGVRKSIVEWSEEIGIRQQTISLRLFYGWNDRDAITVPLNPSFRNITFRRKTMTLSQWAKNIGISYQALSGRLKRGWPLRKALR